MLAERHCYSDELRHPLLHAFYANSNIVCILSTDFHPCITRNSGFRASIKYREEGSKADFVDYDHVKSSDSARVSAREVRSSDYIYNTRSMLSRKQLSCVAFAAE